MIPRYTLPQMADVWSDEARFGQMLRVELAALRVLAGRGSVPQEAFEAMSWPSSSRSPNRSARKAATCTSD
jgi:adenylosuccinate lyase